jgi:UDP-glucuronate 4-epimerase
MLAGEPIDVYGNGKLVRDFTYIDDIVEGVLRVLDKPATPDAGYDQQAPTPAPARPYRIFNIGNGAPTLLMDYIAALDRRWAPRRASACCRSSPATCTARRPTRGAGGLGRLCAATPVPDGVARFVDWYRGSTNHESHDLRHRLRRFGAGRGAGRRGPRRAVRGRR